MRSSVAQGLGHQSEAYFATQRFSCSSKAIMCWNGQGLPGAWEATNTAKSEGTRQEQP